MTTRLKIWPSALIVLALTSPCRPDEPADAKPPEFVEMLRSIIVSGADMGPGTGWFHPAEDRFGWAWLAERCDEDGDKSISREEFAGRAGDFRRLDRDGDGAVEAEDFDWSPDSAYLRQRGMARGRFNQMDANSNGRVSRAEWEAFFARVAKDKTSLTPEDVAAALYAPPPRPSKEDQARMMAQMPSRWTLLKGLFRGEIGSPSEGPHVGQDAPDFTLKTADGTREVTLSEFRGRKPVVLIFGSFT